MSCHDHLKPPKLPTGSEEPGGNDIVLQINLRLRLDEVAELELKQLRHSARRPPTDAELSRLARKIYDARRTRDRMLHRALFGEPGWDILLALYCLPARGELLTVTALSYAANVPESTGHRWQKLLMREGLMEREPDVVDARRQTVRLTTNGKMWMRDYLTRLFYCEAAVPVDSDTTFRMT